MLVSLVFVANVPDKSKKLYVIVCVKLELALFIFIVVELSILESVAVIVEALGIVVKDTVPLALPQSGPPTTTIR